MKTLTLILLLSARLVFAGASTTFDWSEGQPFNGLAGSGVILTTAHPTCTSWVPILGVANATTITSYVTTAATSGKACSFSIYDAAGSTRLVTTGPILCDAVGVFQATSLTPSSFSLNPAIKYQRCWCANAVAGFLSYNTDFGGDFGRGIRNTLAVPLRFTGSTSCGGDGSAPSTLGSFSAADAAPAFVLLGTGTP